MKTECFDYYLPKELIAQIPVTKRDESSLMVLYRNTGEIIHKRFYEITDFLNSGDALVVNDTKVIPARIFGKISPLTLALSPLGRGRHKREILLITEISTNIWETFIKPQRGLMINEELIFNNNSLKAKIKTRTENGTYILEFSNKLPLSNIGYAPLPPYIKRDYRKSQLHEYDKERYQTVYAMNPGAIAAPTAGMHFTEALLDKIKQKGVDIAPITLHVGIGTFRPVRAEDVKEHKMSPEWFNIPEETTRLIRDAKKIIAVGTTTVRALETGIGGFGYTDLFIYPPYEFKVVDGLITNFHLPRSTLLMLVSAFAGRELIMKAYEEAIKLNYRFYSYGDAMLIL